MSDLGELQLTDPLFEPGVRWGWEFQPWRPSITRNSPPRPVAGTDYAELRPSLALRWGSAPTALLPYR
jgi:hypothetical protein